MPNTFHPNISDEHYVAFGMITNALADLDGMLNAVIIAVVRQHPVTLTPILGMLNAKDKRDFIVTMMKGLKSPTDSKQMEKLMSRLKTLSDLRNNIAHNRWKEGRKNGTIKPLVMRAREKLHITGLGDNEKEWTAKELRAEAENCKQLARDLKAYMVKHQLLPKELRVTQSPDRNSSSSKSDNG